MAVFGKEQKVIARLGPIGIVREAFEVFSSHLKFFVCVQLLLMLPLTILGVAVFENVFENAIYSRAPTTLRRSTTHSSFNDNSQRHSRRLLGEDPSAPPSDLAVVVSEIIWGGLGFGISVTGILLLLFIYEAATSLSSSTTLYAVGQHYTGQSVSFQNALSASWKGLWMRVTKTNVCGDLLLCLVWMVVTLTVLLSLVLKDYIFLFLIVIVALLAFVLVARVCLDIIFMLAASVSVLEKHQGWAALGRSRKLLQGRVQVAVLFKLLWWVPNIIVASFGMRSRSNSTTGGSSPGNMAAYVLLSVVYIGLRVFLWQMKALCGGVLYVSFKAYHEEELTESTSKRGFELAPSEKDSFVQSV